MNAGIIGLISAANFHLAAHILRESAGLRDKPGFWGNDLGESKG
jgi:hypothetical protein